MWKLSTPSAGRYCNVYPATAQNVAEAQGLAGQMNARGGTGLLDGMQLSLICASDAPAGLEPILLVLTDGQPHEPIQTILDDTKTRNRRDRPDGDDNVLASIFTIGLGAQANLDFLRQLALQNEGKFQQVYATQDASLQLQDFYSSIATPLLTDVSVVFDYATADQLSLTETEFHTYFWGSELVVAGRLLPGAGDRLTGEITANGAGGVVVRYPIQVGAVLL
ncbi:hypothetical protein ONE63_011297 [Megalurothrips usitatus]|uniref:VWFA domain-containing protein n=1 Tax=Megalurothrips usitatus TaxID=439358 RepID=A0AAV7WZL0_9NEOP|nr:hypothetical protein ONE63_011297 [Megalurothrips usitatus]